jgi:hypothetical protein
MNNLKPAKLENLFSKLELQELHQAISDAIKAGGEALVPHLGRVRVEGINISPQLTDKLTNLASDLTKVKTLKMVLPPLYVEYNAKYGEPNLRPHFDGDSNDYIIDYQLESNTIWPLGVDLNLFSLENNSAVLFGPNQYPHWRPEKTFFPGEYVRMMFFRFFDPSNPSDYSHLPNHPDDPVFAEVNTFRDSLTSD